MCNCVPGEVLRQCSAANPADIYVPSMTVLGLRKIPFYISCPYRHCCLYAYVYIILTPHEYYMVLLPALVINAASKPRLSASALHSVNSSVQYTLLRCAIMTD